MVQNRLEQMKLSSSSPCPIALFSLGGERIKPKNIASYVKGYGKSTKS